MNASKILEITKDEIVPLAEKMMKEKRKLVIMNGYVDKEKKYTIAYNYDIDGTIVTYLCRGETEYPSITSIYGGSVQWCEEEICEMMPVKFKGLEKQNRLFLPDDFDGSGQILVVSMDELKKASQKINNDK